MGSGKRRQSLMRFGEMRRVAGHAYFPIIILITCNLLLGLVIGNNYGESWDEQNGYVHAYATLDAYVKLFKGEALTTENFGPFTRRYYGPFASAAGSLLVGAMGNFPPGWLVVDRWHLTYFLWFQIAIFSLYTICLRLFQERWAAFGTALLFTTQPLLWGHAFINPKDIPFMAFFLAAVATGMGMVDAFVTHKQPQLTNSLPIFEHTVVGVLKSAFQWLYRYIPKEIWFAGIVFGLCVGVRAYGFAAGGLVALYFLFKARWRALPALVAYAGIAYAIMVAVWPYLWAAPFSHYYEALTVLADYPTQLDVLFNGQLYPPTQLPPEYLGKLMSIQFTEPVVVLFLVGILVAVVQAVRRMLDRAMVIVLALWFSVPFVLVPILQVTVYDNFRQFLFIVPPVFVFAGLALKAVLSRLSTPTLKSLVIALVVLPGVFWGVRLHPYQYIYYNSFVGGVDGAAGRYELDYWVTAYKDAIEYLNEHVPPDASVNVFGPQTVFRTYARPDLAAVHERYLMEGSDDYDYDYALLMSRFNYHEVLFVDAPIVYTVQVDGAVLAVVKQLP